jgi:hypothetical protein
VRDRNAPIRTELLKLSTTRMVWGITLVSLALVPGAVALIFLQHTHPLDSAEGVRNIMAAGSSGVLLLLVVGILIAAGEFRHRTATIGASVVSRSERSKQRSFALMQRMQLHEIPQNPAVSTDVPLAVPARDAHFL